MREVLKFLRFCVSVYLPILSTTPIYAQYLSKEKFTEMSFLKYDILRKVSLTVLYEKGENEFINIYNELGYNRVLNKIEPPGYIFKKTGQVIAIQGGAGSFLVVLQDVDLVEKFVNEFKTSKYFPLDSKPIHEGYVPFTINSIDFVIEYLPKNKDYNFEFYIESKSRYSLSKNENSKNSVYAKRINQNALEINSNTNATDIKFKKGDKIYFKASGYISLGVFAGSTGPNGIDGYSEYSILKELRHGCLMASTGNNEWFAVGESYSFIADKDGYLGFMVNDGDPSNNSGSFVVQYSINKPINTNITKPAVATPTRTQNNQQTIQPTTEPAKTPLASFKPVTILEDNFANNKNNWDVSSKNHVISIEGNRLIYSNNEKKDRIYSMVGVPISIKNNDDYIIEASMQSLTPCTNDKLGPLLSMLIAPQQSFYGIAIGDPKNDILFSVGNTVKEKKVRDDYTYTCIPSYFITSTIAGTTNYIQQWTKSNFVADGGNVNILKLEKKGSQFNFYINNRLLSTKNSYSLNNDNAIKIVSSAKSKISVNSIKVILTNSEEPNISKNTTQPSKSNTILENNLIKKEKSTTLPSTTANYEKVKPLTIKTYKGSITNTTLNLKGKCEMTFGKNADGSFQLYGETDNKKLIGKWDLKGRLVENNIYIFNGEILFGYPGTDFPLGTSAPITITVSINDKSMIGNYSIQGNGKNIDSQGGVFTLN